MPVLRRIYGCGMGLLRHYFSPFLRGCSSVVEHLVANENVEGSSPFTRSMPCLSVLSSLAGFS